MAKHRETLRRELMAAVPTDGTAVGNTTLIKLLGWPEDQYWSTREGLIDEGVLERGRGKGGSVRLVLASSAAGLELGPQAAPPETLADDPALAYEKEAKLYPPMREVIASGKVRPAKPLAVEITAMQGRRATGGRWSRPDIVAVEVKTYQYVPGKFIEVTTFEVKPLDYIDVSAVYEALSHLRAATHSYVLFHVPESHAVVLEETLNEIQAVARFHGIGLTTAADPADWTTWEVREEAQRREPDPARLDQFISTQLGPDTLGEIARALR